MDYNNSAKVWTNQFKQPGDKKPSFTGTGTVDGKKYKVALWKNTEQDGRTSLSLKFTPEEPEEELDAFAPPAKPKVKKPVPVEDDDGIPF